MTFEDCLDRNYGNNITVSTDIETDRWFWEHSSDDNVKSNMLPDCILIEIASQWTSTHSIIIFEKSE